MGLLRRLFSGALGVTGLSSAIVVLPVDAIRLCVLSLIRVMGSCVRLVCPLGGVAGAGVGVLIGISR